MATTVRIPLSSSNNGKLVNVAKISTLGTPVHSAAGGSAVDWITLRASNQSSASCLLTVEFGGATDSDVTKITIPGQAGFMTILDRKPLGSSFNMTAFAAMSSVINLDGWVDRVTA